MQPKLRLLLMTLSVILLSFITANSFAQYNHYKENVGSATVTTDKPDYAPRSNAVFTGVGFAPGETVTLKVRNLTQACNAYDKTDSSYQPWTVVADGSGNFVTNWTVCDCAGDSLRLRAVGASSHDTAYTYFSDAAQPGQVTVTATTGTTFIYGTGGTAKYNVKVNRQGTGGGAFSTTLTVTGLPSGVTPSFDVNPLSFGGSNSTLTAVLTLDIGTGADASTSSYTFTVAASGGSTPSATSSFSINKRDLTVSATGVDKTYDGTTAATVTLSDDRVSGDVFTASYTSASFATKDKGTNKTVSVTGISISGTDAGNYNLLNTTGSTTADITARDLTLSNFVAGSKTYDGNTNVLSGAGFDDDKVSGDALTFSYSKAFVDKNVGTGKVVNFTSITISGGADQNNYHLVTTSGVAHADITARDLTVTATGVNKIYDGTTVAAVNFLSDKISADVVNFSYTAQFDNADVGSAKNVSVINIAIMAGGDGANYNLLNTAASTYANITAASTTTTLITSATVVRFMDNLTMTAQVQPFSNGNPITGGSIVTGKVIFTINGNDYSNGGISVVSVPGSTTGLVQATLIKQVAELPGGPYQVVATFISTPNTNYSSSQPSSKALTVTKRNASPYDQNQGFYTGDIFAWTTGQSSSTATIKLSTVIKDNNVPGGDLRAARVTFYLVNGTTVTPISGATNLPVGLIDVNDGSVGAASAIVQFNIGSNNAQDFQVAVGISGAYYNTSSAAESRAIITVSKPVPGGYMVCGGRTQNINSSGYIKGHPEMNTDFESDIVYTKSGTNPKGKASVLVRSYYKIDGTLDSYLHTYIINTNAIASLNVAPAKTSSDSAVATFSSKANLLEQLPDMSLVSIEGGAVFEMIVTQKGCDQRAAITLYRKAGGIWFSNNWISVKTVPQALNGGQASVPGGGTCGNAAMPITTITKSTEVITKQVSTEESLLKAYPNPTTSQFNVKLESSNRQDEIIIIVYNMNGKVVETKQHLTAGQTIQLGSLYRPGVYILEMIQGNQHKQMKLVKIPD